VSLQTRSFYVTLKDADDDDDVSILGFDRGLQPISEHSAANVTRVARCYQLLAAPFFFYFFFFPRSASHQRTRGQQEGFLSEIR
jgi:hypothetical protein